MTALQRRRDDVRIEADAVDRAIAADAQLDVGDGRGVLACSHTMLVVVMDMDIDVHAVAHRLHESVHGPVATTLDTRLAPIDRKTRGELLDRALRRCAARDGRGR